MRPDSTKAGKTVRYPIGRRLDLPEPGDGEEGVDLRQRHGHSGHELGGQQIPARERAYEQGAHVAHFAIVDHGQRRLHAVEQLDQQHQSRRDVDFVEDVGFVGRDDGDTEHLPEPGGEDEEPYQRADERGHEPLALVQETQSFPPHDALEADRVLRRREAVRPRKRGCVDGHEASSAVCDGSSCVSRVKAARISCAPTASITCATGPCARTRP